MTERPNFPEDDRLLASEARAKSQRRPWSPVSGDRTFAGLTDGAALRFSRFKMRQLALVLNLVETGNLHDAAEALYMSQPAATKLLQEIEEALGTTLFIRQSRGMMPTPAGIMAARHAGLILTELRKMQQGVDGLQMGITGYVQIGAIMAAVPGPVTAALAIMAEAHPTVEVSLQVAQAMCCCAS